MLGSALCVVETCAGMLFESYSAKQNIAAVFCGQLSAASQLCFVDSLAQLSLDAKVFRFAGWFLHGELLLADHKVHQPIKAQQHISSRIRQV